MNNTSCMHVYVYIYVCIHLFIYLLFIYLFIDLFIYLVLLLFTDIHTHTYAKKTYVPSITRSSSTNPLGGRASQPEVVEEGPPLLEAPERLVLGHPGTCEACGTVKDWTLPVASPWDMCGNVLKTSENRVYNPLYFDVYNPPSFVFFKTGKIILKWETFRQTMFEYSRNIDDLTKSPVSSATLLGILELNDGV